VPSPINGDAPGHGHDILEEDKQQQQHWTSPLTDTGLTCLTGGGLGR
jgi:hypothetical protein